MIVNKPLNKKHFLVHGGIGTRSISKYNLLCERHQNHNKASKGTGFKFGKQELDERATTSRKLQENL